MSMLRHRDEFLDLCKHFRNEELEPSKPTKEADILEFTYTNRPNEFTEKCMWESDKE